MGGLIDPIKLSFEDDGVKVSQLDVTRTLGVMAKIDKSLIKDYQPLGSVILNSEIIKRLDKFFKTDETINLTLTPTNLKAEGSVETFEADLPVEEVPDLKTEVNETEYGVLLTKPGVKAAFFIDMNEVKSDFGEKRKLIYSANGLSMKIHEDVFRYDKQVRYLKKNVTDSGEVTLDAKILNEICGLCKGPAWLVFTNGPVEVCYKEVGFSVTYIIAPQSE